MIARLETLYAKVPSFTCKDHCSECCGPIQWSDVEDTNIRSYLKEHGMEYKSKRFSSHDIFKAILSGDYSGVTCPYVENDRCMIYPVRPLICRLQGLAEKLPCPHIKPEKVLTKDEINSLFAELIKSRKSARRFTEASACH